MKQPEALILAEIMSQKAKGKTNELGDHWSPMWCEKAAAELRRLHEANEKLVDMFHDLSEVQRKTELERYRLHEVNQELLKALKPFAVYGRPGSKDVEVGAAMAAIAKAQP